MPSQAALYTCARGAGKIVPPIISLSDTLRPTNVSLMRQAQPVTLHMDPDKVKTIMDLSARSNYNMLL